MFYEFREGKLSGFSYLESLENVLKESPGGSFFVINPLGPKRRENYTKWMSFHLFTSMW